MIRFGLLGKNIAYSFSKDYFSQKFKSEKRPFSYENFDVDDLSGFKKLVDENIDIFGFNVTTPYKEEIIPYLDKLDKKAKQIGAVNTITISFNGKTKGYNTDYYGFRKSIKPLIKKHHTNALILGTGGAAKAVAHALDSLKIKYEFVSRSLKPAVRFTYDTLTGEDINKYQIIINCTPIGTHPNIHECPTIPYEAISNTHLLYDLIYNPEETKFLKTGRFQGAQTINGYKMLVFQAEKAWSIWNSTI